MRSFGLLILLVACVRENPSWTPSAIVAGNSSDLSSDPARPLVADMAGVVDTPAISDMARVSSVTDLARAPDLAGGDSECWNSFHAECVSCCQMRHPSGDALFIKAMQSCECGVGGQCSHACETDFCMTGEENTTACGDCISASTCDPSKQCRPDPDCSAFLDCAGGCSPL
jgi:hypothetical protein